MDMGLRSQPVLVTGASTGIGRAIATELGREGARVALTYKTKREEAEKTAAQVRRAGGEALVLAFDLGEPGKAHEVVAAVAERFGGLAALVNNAVRWPAAFAPVEKLSLEEWHATVHANLDGSVFLTQAAIPHLRKSGQGRIVTISTGLAVDGNPGSGAYIAAKAAWHGLNRTLAKELGPDAILCNVLMSGAVASEVRVRTPEMLEQMAKSAVTGRLTLADEVARAAVFLASPANGHITGESIRVDGFFVTPPRR